MRVIATSTLRAFWAAHPETEQPLKSWLEEVQTAQWQQPSDVKAQFGSASILKDRRIVFNIKGNQYRIVVAVAYSFGAVYIKFIGTHAEYDAIEAQSVESKK